MVKKSALLAENGKFLLAAKWNRRSTCTEYVISMDADNISRSNSSYIGKVRRMRMDEALSGLRSYLVASGGSVAAEGGKAQFLYTVVMLA
ncbi:tubby, conserved site, Tubby C-terminal-like domain protein [Artemisia annua]|uniref:Tubby, conserved site, Tubby C-terminal-like domain protein n=1 Tax=Artemisia annua TaxID=35608 RepID=A0A2U1MDG1_ARTAN|nr:tubby, conserved site, Tubby C-terminal-like domain protein [Artemisia annua]